MFWFCLLLLTVPSQPSVLPPTAAYGRKLLELKKAIFTSLIKIINISNCRQEKGGTKIWSVWYLPWREVTHATTSIIKIVYSNWRPQMKNIFMFSMVCYIWRMFIRIGEVLQSQWVYYFSIFGSILRCCCFYQPFPKFCFVNKWKSILLNDLYDYLIPYLVMRKRG